MRVTSPAMSRRGAVLGGVAIGFSLVPSVQGQDRSEVDIDGMGNAGLAQAGNRRSNGAYSVFVMPRTILEWFPRVRSIPRAKLGSADPPIPMQNLRARLAKLIGTSMRMQHLSLLEKSGIDLGLQCVSFLAIKKFP